MVMAPVLLSGSHGYSVSKGETDHGYSIRTLADARRLGLSLVFRSGGGSALGHLGGAVGSIRSRFVLFGGLNHWCPQDVEQVLTNLGWTETSGITAPRFRKQGWIFSAVRPSKGVDDFVYDILAPR